MINVFSATPVHAQRRLEQFMREREFDVYRPSESVSHICAPTRIPVQRNSQMLMNIADTAYGLLERDGAKPYFAEIGVAHENRWDANNLLDRRETPMNTAEIKGILLGQEVNYLSLIALERNRSFWVEIGNRAALDTLVASRPASGIYRP